MTRLPPMPTAPGVPELSVAVPAYNEAQCLPELYDRVAAVAERAGLAWELVVADDGSTDGTRELLRQMAERDPRVKPVMLSRNFGHTPAYLAAMEHATGDWVVVMDSDLQDEPEVIPDMLAIARTGLDVVYAIKAKRQEGVLMRAAFSLYYRLAGRMSAVPQPAHAGPFCLMSRRVVEEIRRLPERNVFFPGVRSYVGFRQAGIQVERPARADASRIRLGRRVAGAIDGILAFSNVPLRVSSWIGMVVAAASGILGLVFIYYRLFTDTAVEGFTAMVTILLFLGGVQLLTLGILGEYIGRVYEEVKRRPRYIVEEFLNGEGAEEREPPQKVLQRDGF